MLISSSLVKLMIVIVIAVVLQAILSTRGNGALGILVPLGFFAYGLYETVIPIATTDMSDMSGITQLAALMMVGLYMIPTLFFFILHRKIRRTTRKRKEAAKRAATGGNTYTNRGL